LIKRSKIFYVYALMAFERGDYDMTLFMCEQSVQLRIKAVLLRLLGYIPKGHRVRELLMMLSKTLESLGREDIAREISDLISLYRDDLRLLEEAYTGSRYLSRIYDKDDAEKAIKIVDKIFSLVEKVERIVFSK